MKKVKSRVKILALTAAITAATAGVKSAYVTNAQQSQNLSDSSIELNVEKLDRDTVKIYLSNFSDLAKSLQLSVKIEDGNVKFNEESINWIINKDDENIKADYKIDDDKKVIDFFVVSNEAINSDGGVIEICEIDVEKDESILEKLIKSSDSGYKVVPNIIDGEAYSYITYASNRKVSGEDIVNASEEKLTINSNPVISFRNVSSIVENKIVISKGDIFNIKDYVMAHDADGNEIENIEYTGKVDNKKPGSYNIVCKVTDSHGDSSALETTVIVEESVDGNASMPVITGADKPLEILIGEDFDLEDGITALDYMGRTLAVTISGEYNTDKPGRYTIIYSAADRFNNIVTVERTLIVKEKDGTLDSGNSNENVSGDLSNGTVSGSGTGSGSSGGSSSSGSSNSGSGNLNGTGNTDEYNESVNTSDTNTSNDVENESENNNYSEGNGGSENIIIDIANGNTINNNEGAGNRVTGSTGDSSSSWNTAGGTSGVISSRVNKTEEDVYDNENIEEADDAAEVSLDDKADIKEAEADEDKEIESTEGMNQNKDTAANGEADDTKSKSLTRKIITGCVIVAASGIYLMKKSKKWIFK